MRRMLGAIGALALASTAPASAAGAAGERWERALAGHIQEYVRLRLHDPGARVVVPALSDFRFPDGIEGGVGVKLSTSRRGSFRSHVPVTVSLLKGEREIKRGVVTVRVERRRAIPVAARALPARVPIGEDDVRLASVDASSMPDDALLDSASIVGRETTRAVSAGVPLRAAYVQDAPAVSRGQLVRLRVENGALRIEAVGRVREDAAVGDRVRVLNVHSRRELVGVVGEEGVVHVEF